jgi:hypothetical protein
MSELGDRKAVSVTDGPSTILAVILEDSSLWTLGEDQSQGAADRLKYDYPTYRAFYRFKQVQGAGGMGPGQGCLVGSAHGSGVGGWFAMVV